MQRQARRDTGIEKKVRQELYARGLRYRLQVRLLPRHTADIVFKGPRLVVDVRSCFWHACPEHSGVPHSNTAWWLAKFARTAERDQAVKQRLESSGWTVIVVWEHDDLKAVADEIEATVRSSKA
jgi:DNA mismatch endonuclease, patch repair protein